MYRELSESLMKKYKEDNILFIKVVSALLIFTLPIILLFAPLPAYLIYTTSVVSLPFAVSTITMLTITILLSAIYDKIHPRQYMFWAILITSHSKVKSEYCKGQFIFSWATFLLLMSGALKLDSIYDALPELLFFLVAQYLYYRYRFDNLFKSQKIYSNTPMPCKIFIEVFSKIIFHFAIFVILILFSASLIVKSNVNSVSLIVSLFIISICLTLSFTMKKIAFQELEKYKSFTISISPRLYDKFINSMRLVSVLMNVAPILIYSLWVIRII